MAAGRAIRPRRLLLFASLVLIRCSGAASVYGSTCVTVDIGVGVSAPYGGSDRDSQHDAAAKIGGTPCG